MRIRAVAITSAVIACSALAAYLWTSGERSLGERSPSVPEPTRSDGQSTAPPEQRTHRRAHAPDGDASPSTSQQPEAPSAWASGWADLILAERRTSQSLVSAFVDRDDLYKHLVEVGMVAPDEVAVARIERAFNEYLVSDGADRSRALAVIESSAREFGDVLQRKSDVGMLSEADAKSMTGAVAALRGSLRWYDSAALRRSSNPTRAAEPQSSQPEPARPATTDRGAVATLLRETRERGLREESAILNRLLASDVTHVKAADLLAARIRQLVVTAQLGEIDFATAKQRADELLAIARPRLDPTDYEDVSSLAKQLDWYGCAAMRKLYGG